VEANPRTVESYQAGDSVPFDDWLGRLKDSKGKAQIEARINRLRRGSLGDFDDVGEGILELRLDSVGPGYRVYIADNGVSSLLLCGGTKRTQASDIAKAKRFWKEYKRRDA
jgi:putative addiction module killer protein